MPFPAAKRPSRAGRAAGVPAGSGERWHNRRREAPAVMPSSIESPPARDQRSPANVRAALAAALPPGLWDAPVLAGVSGGADSVALLLGLHGLVPDTLRRRLIVAHVEHDLRGEAAADRDFVAALAERLGLTVVVGRVAVRGPADVRGEGLEARARRLRYRFLESAALEAGARHVVVAHTADDQAETILHRALRGTGVAGLGGMRRARPLCPGVSLLRPLLHVSRQAARAFLLETAQEWREDATNADTLRARNFLRHEVLARCAAGPYPAVTAALVRLGGQAAAAADALASAAEYLLEMHAQRHGDGSIVLRTRGLAALDPHLLAEVFVALWRREGWPRRDMTAAHYGRLAMLVATPDRQRPGACDLPGGIRAEAAADRLLLAPGGASGGVGHEDISTRR